MPEVTRETPLDQDKLARYAALVRRFAPRLDLVAPGDLDAFETRHVADSLKATALVRGAPPGPAIDVGSGAGLPGIPLAIADPSRPWRLLEPRRGRAAFLEEAVRELELDCDVIVATATEAARRFGPGHSVATARALAPVRSAIARAVPLVAPGGVAIVWIGERAEIPPEATVTTEGLAIVRP